MIHLSVKLTLLDVKRNEVFRIVHIDYIKDEVFLFNCSRKVTEEMELLSLSKEELNERFDKKEIEITKDTFIRYVEESKISPRDKAIKDKMFSLVDSIINHPDIYIPTIRLQLVNKTVKKYKVSKPTVYKALKKFWKHGMNPNALYPDYQNCGASGNERKSGASAEARKIISRGFKNYVLDEGFDIKNAYRATIEKYCSGENLFSFNSFYRFGGNEFSEEKKKRAKMSEHEFESDHRLLHGRSNDIVTGPCMLYQIDSTKRDVRVVSTINPSKYIGRPTFYIVTDVWTRAYVGFHITLDPPSYIAAAEALFNAFRPKSHLIEELKIDKKHLGWSSHFLPVELVADRAELLGPKSNQIVSSLNIRQGNTVAYRADLKGNVEKAIDLVQERVKNLFDNHGQVTKKDGKRGEKDTRLDASVTLEELYCITWITINEFNNTHWIDDYPLTAEMIRDGVKKIPAELHKWGIKQNLGVERVADEKTLWLNLMESIKLSPNRKGIRLNKQDYVPVDEEPFKLLQNLISSPNIKKVEIKFDPRNYKNIYWVYKGNFYKLRLRGKNDVQYNNKWEAESTVETYTELRKECTGREEKVRNENDAEIKNILNSKQKKKVDIKNTNEARSLQREYNRSKINNIKENPETTSKKSDNVVINVAQKKLLDTLRQINE